LRGNTAGRPGFGWARRGRRGYAEWNPHPSRRR
jgi:hypothetical protein